MVAMPRSGPRGACSHFQPRRSAPPQTEKPSPADESTSAAAGCFPKADQRQLFIFSVDPIIRPAPLHPLLAQCPFVTSPPRDLPRCRGARHGTTLLNDSATADESSI